MRRFIKILTLKTYNLGTLALSIHLIRFSARVVQIVKLISRPNKTNLSQMVYAYIYWKINSRSNMKFRMFDWRKWISEIFCASESGVLGKSINHEWVVVLEAELTLFSFCFQTPRNAICFTSRGNACHLEWRMRNNWDVVRW